MNEWCEWEIMTNKFLVHFFAEPFVLLSCTESAPLKAMPTMTTQSAQIILERTSTLHGSSFSDPISVSLSLALRSVCIARMKAVEIIFERHSKKLFKEIN